MSPKIMRKEEKSKTTAISAAAAAAVQPPSRQNEYAEIQKPRRSLLEKISKTSVCLLAALLPLWFLPFTQDVLAYQKQVLLIVFALAGFVAWLANAIGTQAFLYRKHLAFAALGILTVVFGLSSLFSLWRYGSFWGFPLNSSDSFVTFLGFAFLYALTANIYKETKQLQLPYVLLIGSVFLGAVFTALQTFGIFLLPFSFAQSSSFNTMGSVNNAVMIAAVVLPLAIALAFSARAFLRWMLIGVALLLLAFLALINFFNAWLVLFIGLSVLLVFGVWGVRKKIEFGWMLLPIAMISVALFFLLFRIAVPWAPQVPVEVSPSFSAEFDIAKNVLKSNVMTGSGPGTFLIDYAKYRSEALNQTVFWGTRFSSGSFELFDWVVTKGVLGILALLFFAAVTVRSGFKGLLVPHDDHSDWMTFLGSAAMFAGAAGAISLSPAPLPMWLLFWMSAAAVLVGSVRERKTISLMPPSRFALVISSAFLFAFIFGIGFLYVQGQKYIADIRYLQGIASFQKGDSALAVSRMRSAVQLNPSVDMYWRDLAQIYLTQIGPSFTNETLSKEQRQQQAQIVMSNAIAAAKQATVISPNNVANWNVLGFVYRNLIGIPQAEEFALSSYQKAVELEPASPFAWTEMGRVYAASAKALASQNDGKQKSAEAYDKALEMLKKSAELKADYAPAHFLIAMIYDEQGKNSEALRKLREIAQTNPNDVGTAFQLGVVYWQKNDTESARQEFERAKALNPLYANARYMLGLVYEKQGNVFMAKEEFQAVLKLNPDNEELKTILANLDAGKPALEGVSVGQPPVSENPPEIKTQEQESAPKAEKKK